MPKCLYHNICGLTDEADPAAGLCILHSHEVNKNPETFDNALRVHRQARGDQFAYMVFPPEASSHNRTLVSTRRFGNTTFSREVDFRGATFSGLAVFTGVVFPGVVKFSDTSFSVDAYFNGATFGPAAHFDHATFSGRTDFAVATFSGVTFSHATFSGRTSFGGAKFFRRAEFIRTIFSAETDFDGATFSGRTSFFYTTFSAETNFQRTCFSTDYITFQGSRFSGRTLFAGKQAAEEKEGSLIFTQATTVNLCDLVIEPPESVRFRYADFRTCRFLNTDLRKVELTGVLWPKNPVRWPKTLVRWPKTLVRWYEKGEGTRHVAFDEIASIREAVYPWDQLERLYRELKQNYDERRNYPRVGDFHYGEKEIQRHNPATPRSLKIFLWLYWLVSGYGERFLRPLLCALVLLIGATVAYLWCGLVPKAPPLSTMPETSAFLVMPGAVIRPAPLPITQPNAWFSALHYSLRVMTLLKPEDLDPMGFAKVVQTFQSLLGPLFLGLFALAVRQRLKH